MLMGEWLSMWLELYVDPARLATSTKACYHRAAAAVPEWLRRIPLKDLSPLDLRRWLLAVAAATPRAAQLDRVMLSRCLTVAAKLGFCPSGLVDDDVCPPIDHTPRKALTLNAAEMRAYMAAAAASPVAPVLLLCCCGLRRGEALGARWEHLDVGAGTLAVVAQRVGDKSVPLKTAASRRVIKLPRQLLSLLIRSPRRSGWLCDCSTNKVYAEHRRVLVAAQLPPVTLHGLRHPYVKLKTKLFTQANQLFCRQSQFAYPGGQ